MSKSNPAIAPSSAFEQREPAAFAISHNRLAMWLFLVSDAITFGVILFAYGYLRNASTDWPTPFGKSSVLTAYALTFTLVTGSLMMVLAGRAAGAGNRSKAALYALFTVAGGIAFAFLHVREWIDLIGAGLRMFRNPWGSGLFGAAFFSITGLHLAHVVVGTVAIAVLAFGFNRGKYGRDDLEIWGLYWHFVDVVWMFIFPFVYLLSVRR